MTYQQPVTLPRDTVSHWSIAMYGNSPTGHIHTYVQKPGEGSVAAPAPGAPFVLLNVDTPGGHKAPAGIHGGARRIDIALTPRQARSLAAMLLKSATEASL